MMKTRNRNAILEMLAGNISGRALRVDWESTIDFTRLTELAISWWADYKDFERDDTVEAAYYEQRLTVKGGDTEWKKDIAFKNEASKQFEVYKDKDTGKSYPLLKGLQGMTQRCDPTNFLPYGGGESRKTEIGLHDMSTGLMTPLKKISDQQYKTLGKGTDNHKGQIYVFMPLGYPQDQAVFQLLNDLAKRVRQERPNFHELIRFYRARMTRVKLAAEHDMSTNFSLAPTTHKMVHGERVPKFQFSLISKTDATIKDKDLLDETGKQQLAKGLKLGKITQVKTTPELLAARRQAALDYQNLVLKTMRYGELVVSYRKHEGDFPKYTMFSPDEDAFIVGNISGSSWTARTPAEVIKLTPRVG